MKITISLPDRLFEAAETLAGRLGLSRSELYRRALGDYLVCHFEDGVTEKLDEVYGRETEGEALDPILERAQVASIQDEEWR